MNTSSRIRNLIRSKLERLLHIQISRNSHHGHDVCNDIRRIGVEIGIIFDVGANDGESALSFLRTFPNARIHCFEPVRQTFAVLEQNVRPARTISCHNMALGNCEEDAVIYLTGTSTTSSLLKPPRPRGSEGVRVSTLDKVAEIEDVSRIDLLKIDTEGYDLRVLEGSHMMLSHGRIAFILVEVGFNPGNMSQHVRFEDIRLYLESLGYAIFGIYGQQTEREGRVRLRYANICFAYKDIVRRP